MSLPERINVMKVVTYDVTKIVHDMRSMLEDSNHNPPLDDVVDWILDWVLEDFGQSDFDGLIFQDENGNEL